MDVNLLLYVQAVSIKLQKISITKIFGYLVQLHIMSKKIVQIKIDAPKKNLV